MYRDGTAAHAQDVQVSPEPNYRLNPTPHQELALATVVLRSRARYTVALEQRKTWWQRGQDRSATSCQQQAAWPDR
jgi:hypothetical protein